MLALECNEVRRTFDFCVEITETPSINYKNVLDVITEIFIITIILINYKLHLVLTIYDL